MVVSMCGAVLSLVLAMTLFAISAGLTGFAVCTFSTRVALFMVMLAFALFSFSDCLTLSDWESFRVCSENRG